MSETPQRQYGGQALIEGVMIRGAKHVCVACRRAETDEQGELLSPEDSPLFVQAETISTFAGRLARDFALARWPFVRGTLVLLESMELGAKGLRLSASVAVEGVARKPAESRAPVPDSTGQDALDRSAFDEGLVRGDDPGQTGRRETGDDLTLIGTASTAPGSLAATPADSFRGSADGGPAPGNTAESRESAVAVGGAPVSRQALLTGALLLAVAAVLFLFFRLGWLDTPGARIAAIVGGAIAAGLVLLVGMVRREEEKPVETPALANVAVGATMALGLAMGIGVFFLIPSLVTELFRRLIDWPWVLNLVEGVIRIGLFFGYLALIARMPNIHRIFQYHGAEHQVIHVHENGLELTPENTQKFPTIHPRCGTAFLAIVLVISVVVFAPLGWQVLWKRMLIRIIGLPLIAGISYELLKLNSRWPNPVLKALVAPGLWFQRITTQPPSRDQVEVAIAAMKGVVQAEEIAGL